jgi:ketosteroid isomerase-like protein
MKASETMTVEAEVKEAVNSYYAALTALFKGDIRQIDAVWSHADDVVMMSPMGDIKVGWTEARKLFEQVMNALEDGHVEATAVAVTVIGDAAIAAVREVGSNTTKDGKRIDVDIRATNAYRREGNAWKMILHHCDQIPEMAKGFKM